MYKYFPEDNTNAVLFRGVVSTGHWDSIIIQRFWENHHFVIWGPSDALQILEMKCSDSACINLEWMNSRIQNMNKICLFWPWQSIHPRTYKRMAYKSQFFCRKCELTQCLILEYGITTDLWTFCYCCIGPYTRSGGLSGWPEQSKPMQVNHSFCMWYN
jgi:hypothetical protein